MVSIHTWDYIVFFLSVLISLGIGVYFAYRGKGLKSLDDYFLAGGDLHYVPVAISLIVSFQSSVLIMGQPAEVYIYGISHVLTMLGDLPCMLLLNVITIPLFYKMRLTSIYQYVQTRFKEESEMLRIFLVFLGMLFTVIYTSFTSLVLLGPAYAIDALTGFPVWASITGSSVVAVIYTTLGGMKAVIWTDMFQFVVMLAGMLAVFIKAVVVVGGIDEVLSISSKYGRTDVFNFNPNPWIRHTFWSLLIGSFCRQMLLLFSQQSMQRLNSTRTAADAKKVVFVFIPFVAILNLVADGSGLAAFAYYAKKRCDPLASGRISNPNQIFIVLMSDLFQGNSGLTGLVTAAILSACLSTVSSSLNGLAANTIEEFLKNKMLSEGKRTVIAKCSVVGFGILSTFLALAMTFVKGSLSQIFISILGSVGAPMVGMFLLTIFRRKIAVPSVVIGGLFGLIISMWMSVGYSFSSSLPETPWLPLGPTDFCQTSNTSVNLNRTILGGNSISVVRVEPTVDSILTRDFKASVSQNISEELNEHFNSTKMTINSYISANKSSTYIVSSMNETERESQIEGLNCLYSISYQYFSVISMLVTIIVGSIASIFLTKYATVADRGTIITFRQLCPCLKQKREPWSTYVVSTPLQQRRG